MKKLLVLSALFLLSACIDVADYGKFWSKTTLDPALKGSWSKIAGSTKNSDDGEGTCRVRERKGAYEVSCDDKDNKNKKPDYPVKTLTFGPYHFFALKTKGTKGGELFRYDVADNVLTIYNLKAPDAISKIARNFPEAQISQINLSDSDNSSYLSIRILDAASAQAIGSIPNDENYWEVAAQFEKVRK